MQLEIKIQIYKQHRLRRHLHRPVQPVIVESVTIVKLKIIPASTIVKYPNQDSFRKQQLQDSLQGMSTQIPNHGFRNTKKCITKCCRSFNKTAAQQKSANANWKSISYHWLRVEHSSSKLEESGSNFYRKKHPNIVSWSIKWYRCVILANVKKIL